MARKKFYAVRKGRQSYVITDSWDECSKLVSGFPGAKFKGFSSREEAEAWLYERDREYEGVSSDALFADGGVSSKSGIAEARVTDINGKTIIHKQLGNHTNNYAELAAVGLALVYAIEHGIKEIYTDSQVVLSWIVNGPRSGVHEIDMIRKMIAKINHLLRENPNIRILKWNTARFGEIPADFGRK